MRILKFALSRCLWIVFAGSLKVALVVYIFFLPDTAVANAAPAKALKGAPAPMFERQKEILGHRG